jgi:hypothetical protein
LIFFDQDMIRHRRRNAREPQQGLLVSVSLQAAIRSEIDLFGIAPNVPARKALPVPAFA